MNNLTPVKKSYLIGLVTCKWHLFLLCITIVFASGCSSYQYISVSSHLQQNEKKEFINENDTVLITYTFSGENFPVTITVYNKLKQPLYIDLGRSPVIFNNRQSNAFLNQDEQISFIAPLSYVTLKSSPLKYDFIETDTIDKTGKVKISGSNSSGKTKSYSEQTTPVFLRIILAITTNEDYSYPTFFDYSFWVSDIIQTSARPSSMPDRTSNQFFIRKNASHNGQWLFYGILVTALVVLMAASGG
jgi:hypothetical protein